MHQTEEKKDSPSILTLNVNDPKGWASMGDEAVRSLFIAGVMSHKKMREWRMMAVIGWFLVFSLTVGWWAQ